MYDLLIKNGKVVDGTGKSGFHADVAVVGDKIAAIGSNLGAAREIIDADGLLVTPGFVDIHTHYDAQVLFDDIMANAVWHGTTTGIMTSCGIGLAPAGPHNRDFVVDLMAVVEDIPEKVLAGLDWDWETFPQYLDAVDSKPRTIDVSALLPVGALRSYVMGERAHEAPNDQELARMAALVKEAVRAGALGVTLSRTVLHADSSGRYVPGTYATDEELTMLAAAMRETGRGLLQLSSPGIAFPEPVTVTEEADRLIRIAEETGCPICFLLTQSHFAPDEYRTVLDRCEAAARRGIPIFTQVNVRPTADLFTFLADNHPFRSLPSYKPLLGMAPKEKIPLLRDPALRARLLSEQDTNPKGLDQLLAAPAVWDSIYLLGRVPNYFPSSEDSVSTLASQAGVGIREFVYDKLLENDGQTFLMYVVSNWAHGNDAALFDLLSSPVSVIGLNDSGAHLTQVCDASQSTTLLMHYVRDKDPSDPTRIPIETAIRKLASDNATLYGLHDRGVLAPGMRADINLIDLANLSVTLPKMIYDMPQNAPRLDQQATGYEAMLVAGEVVVRRGELTGARPGRVARF